MRGENATAARNADAAAAALLRQTTARLVAVAGDDRALVHLMETARQVSAGALDKSVELDSRGGG